MKKTICIILVMVMLLLSSCATTITTSINTETPETTENIPITVPIYEVTETPEPEPTVDLKSIRYTINVGTKPSMIKSDDVILDHNGNPVTFNFELFDELNWLRYGKITIPEVDDSKDISLNGTQYKLDYVETFNHYLVKNEDRIFVSHYEFSDDNVEIKAEFIDKRLIAFSYTLKNNEEKGNFTVEEAVSKAKEYLSSLYYYKSNLDKYVLSHITKNNGTLSLTYDSSDTGEELYIDFDSMGRIVNFDIKSSKIFEPQDIALWEEKIENAKKAVRSSLSDEYELEDCGFYSFFIHPDTGEIIAYLWVNAKDIPDGHFQAEHSYSVYVNID